MATAEAVCSCGAPMIRTHNGKAVGCVHCDSLCKVERCDACRRLARVTR